MSYGGRSGGRSGGGGRIGGGVVNVPSFEFNTENLESLNRVLNEDEGIVGPPEAPAEQASQPFRSTQSSSSMPPPSTMPSGVKWRRYFFCQLCHLI